MNTLVLQLSDPHIHEPDRLAYSRIETADYLRRAIATIAKLPQQPDAVVITGDLTDFGRAAETTICVNCWRRWPCRCI